MGVCCSFSPEIIKGNTTSKQINSDSQLTKNNKSHRNSIFTYTINQENLKNSFQIETQIGKGLFGKVSIGYRLSDRNTKYAIKSIDKKLLEDEKLIKYQREIDIIKILDHPNIIKYYEIYNDEKSLHIVMELLNGGELYKRLLMKKKFSEYETAEIIYKIVYAISHCHELGIVHRDIKPENILFDSNSDSSELKIIDFGLSRTYEDSLMSSIVGTPFYVAPEVLEGSYNKKCDYWSIGVIMYLLLSGNLPFYSLDNKELYSKIKNEEVSFESKGKQIWNRISIEAKHLIKGLLCKNPSKRLSSKEIFNSDWMKKYIDVKYGNNLNMKEILLNIKSFHIKHRIGKVFMRCLLMVVKKEELNFYFNILDDKRIGFIDYSYIRRIMKYSEIDYKDDDKLMIFNMKIGNKGKNDQLNYSSFLCAALGKKTILNNDILLCTFKYIDWEGKGYFNINDIKLLLDRSCLTKDYNYIKEMFIEIGLNEDDIIDYDLFNKLMINEIM